MPLDDELKKAIVQMLPKEKDKLLLRLITKDKALTDKLYFELVEESSTISERRMVISDNILNMSTMPLNSPAWILAEMRNLSGEITYHVKITKDKVGGLELNLLLLNLFLSRFSSQLVNFSHRTEKCAQYIAKKALTTVNGLNKLDDDFRFDYLEDANIMLALVHDHCSKVYARQLDIPTKLE
jgi:hypothetical protein